MAASATFALKAGVWFRRGRLVMVSPDSLGTACPLSGRNSTYRPVQISETGSKGGMNAELFIGMLEALMRHRKKPLYLILDSLPAHKAKIVQNYVASTNGKLELHFLPGYAPELNPDEMVWNHMKRTGTARSPLAKGESLHDRIDIELLQIQQNRALVRSFFRAESVSYIND